MRVSPEVTVIGAGVSGLTTALVLAEAGVIVRVVAELRSQVTTSAAAGAVWGPYAVSDPRVLRWSMQTLRRFRRCEADENSGVHSVDGLEASRTPVQAPDWAPFLPHFALADAAELPDGFVSGWRYRVPVVDMSKYLDYLSRKLIDLGVEFEFGIRFSSFGDVPSDSAMIVNCCGLGARELAADPDVYPVWGQLVVLRNPGIKTFFSDYPESEEPLYFMPQEDIVVLGGTIVPNKSSLTVEDHVTLGIIERCALVEPALADAEFVTARVGLRPARAAVRLERSIHAGRPVIHNYGHGGSGVTLSWGCAYDVLSLLD